MLNNIFDYIKQWCLNKIVATCFEQLLIFGRVVKLLSGKLTTHMINDRLNSNPRKTKSFTNAERSILKFIRDCKVLQSF